MADDDKDTSDYRPINDGEMEEWTPDADYYIACCHCGLIHRIQVSKPVVMRWIKELELTKNYRKDNKRDLVCSVKRRRKTT